MILFDFVLHCCVCVCVSVSWSTTIQQQFLLTTQKPTKEGKDAQSVHIFSPRLFHKLKTWTPNPGMHFPCSEKDYEVTTK